MNYCNGKTKNLKMNDDTYKLRRQVINIIYDAKKMVFGIPRITVRITENHKSMLGCAKIKGNILWITKRAIKDYTPTQLRAIVYHEILHAVYGIKHNENCPLMSSVINKNITEEQCRDQFKYWLQKEE